MSVLLKSCCGYLRTVAFWCRLFSYSSNTRDKIATSSTVHLLMPYIILYKCFQTISRHVKTCWIFGGSLVEASSSPRMAIIGMFYQDGLTGGVGCESSSTVKQHDVAPGSAWGDWSLYTDSPLRAFEDETGDGEGLVAFAFVKTHTDCRIHPDTSIIHLFWVIVVWGSRIWNVWGLPFRVCEIPVHNANVPSARQNEAKLVYGYII